VAEAEAALKNALAAKATAEASLASARASAATAAANVETALVRQRKAASDLARDTNLFRTGRHHRQPADRHPGGRRHGRGPA
jgi:multidrug resistance efflux pump